VELEAPSKLYEVKREITATVCAITLVFSIILIVPTLGYRYDDLWVVLFPFLFLAGLFFGIVLYELSRFIPHSRLITTAFACLIEAVLLPPLIHTLTGMQIGWFIFVPWLFTLLAPLIVYALAGGGYSASFVGRDLTDDQVLALAKKYGGILTPSVLVWELKIPLEVAKKALERFCKHGEAHKKEVGSLTIYDFPGARIYLSGTDNQIVEVLRDNPHGMSRTQLLQAMALSIESLDEALRRLESKGIIYYDIESDVYRLMGIAPTTKSEGVAVGNDVAMHNKSLEMPKARE